MSEVVTLPCPSCHRAVAAAPASNVICPHCGLGFAVHRWHTSAGETGPGSFTCIDAGGGMAVEDPLLIPMGPGPCEERALRGPVTVIGRWNADVLVTDPRTSRQHAAIERQGRRCLLRDLASTHGTCVNGRQVELVLLRDGDVIRLGSTEMRFVSSRLSLSRFRALEGAAGRTGGDPR